MKNFDERRRVNDRRKFNYTACSPERRSGHDRRAVNMTKFKKRVA
ncbi:MAG: hypothetical protein PF690_06670 [Deltaproteobacteria bacterium]|jgi:hypothetical protein|nr:hypothetical protein [Deltaproteobacteria bacterium]